MGGRQMCFIQCARRKLKHGHIAVKRQRRNRGRTADFYTCCVPSKREAASTVCLLFQLVRTRGTKVRDTVRTDGETRLICTPVNSPEHSPIESPSTSDSDSDSEDTFSRGAAGLDLDSALKKLQESSSGSRGTEAKNFVLDNH